AIVTSGFWCARLIFMRFDAAYGPVLPCRAKRLRKFVSPPWSVIPAPDGFPVARTRMEGDDMSKVEAELLPTCMAKESQFDRAMVYPASSNEAKWFIVM